MARPSLHSTPQRITLVESPTDTPQGVTMDMDSYQPTTEVRLPTRKRRPWWRWNLITLAIVLFVLLWTRELLQFDPSSVWLSAGTIFFLWILLPVPWATSLFTTMPDYSEVPLRKKGVHRKVTVKIGRFLAFLLAITAIGSGMMQLYWIVTFVPSGRYRFPGPSGFVSLRFAGMVVETLLYVTAAALLWLLAEAIEKLDYVLNELRSQGEGRDKEAHE